MKNLGSTIHQYIRFNLLGGTLFVVPPRAYFIIDGDGEGLRQNIQTPITRKLRNN